MYHNEVVAYVGFYSIGLDTIAKVYRSCTYLIRIEAVRVKFSCIGDYSLLIIGPEYLMISVIILIVNFCFVAIIS